ncbi:MAG: lysophospholipid acyltransferase family protein [Alphaproteobacteria bacterium]
MTPFKYWLRAPSVQALASRMIAGYVRLVKATSRWRTVGAEVPARLWDANQPFIVCFWHGRLLMMPLGWPPGVAVKILISSHADGRLIARVIGRFGLGTITGSTRRGGSEALRAMLRALRRGEPVVLTPDGPRGPRMRADGAIVDLARLSGRPIVPAAFAASRCWIAPSWDRFVVALPFTRGVYVWGEPVAVPRDADAAAIEAARHLVEERLNAATAEADRRVGRAAIEPAPVEAARARA